MAREDGNDYRFEDVRDFFVRRSFLSGPVLTAVEYVRLKERLQEPMPDERIAYLRAFIDGWLMAMR